MNAGWNLAVTGATYTLSGDILTLNIGQNGLHAVTVTQTAPNTAPTDITVANLTALAENTAVRTLIANLTVVDPDTLPASLNNIVTVSDARFEYDALDGGLYLRAGQIVDFEATPAITLTLTATDAVNAALTYSEALTITVLNGNDGLGVLPARIVSMERASTDTPLNLTVPADPDGDPQTFIVSALPGSGALRLGGVAVTAGQTLTLAQFQALTYSFPDVAAQDIAMTIMVDDGQGHLDPLSVILRVTNGVNSVLNGTAGADRLDGAFGDDTLNGLGGIDLLIGGIGNDALDGGIGADTMQGGAGNDRYYIDNAADQALESASSGTDTAYASVSYALLAGQHIETLSARTPASTAALNLTGNELVNTLLGSAGINILDGGAGADRLYGLGGNDQYYVDNAADQVFETAGNGADTVFASVSYALLAGQQVETLRARDAASTAALNLTGNEIANALIGNAGANTLDGRAGADSMTGGAGNDLYIVDNAGDAIVEGAGQGTLDRVNTSVSYALAAGLEIEAFATTNASAALAISLTGNEFNQTITGNAGANVIDGRGGADLMAGGAGNDFYFVDNAGDAITEGANQGTLDQVAASVSYVLAAGVQAEALATASAAGTGAIDLTGNEFAQTVTGNAGANVLNGRGGIDRLTGGLGADTFVFNTALGASNVDIILDFDPSQDQIQLEDLIFAALPALFTADQFAINATGLAQDGSDRIIYQTTTGNLYYDSNGNAAGGAVQFATLTANLAVTFEDFVVG